MSRRLLTSSATTEELVVMIGGATPARQPDGRDGFDFFSDGAVYDVSSGTWSALSEAPISGRIDHSATFAGSELLVWGGNELIRDADLMDRARLPWSRLTATGTNTGAALDLATGSWRTISDAPILPRSSHEAVWTGSELVVFGGVLQTWSGLPAPESTDPGGAAYDPVTDSWRTIRPHAGMVRSAPAVAWTGDEILVWGGQTFCTLGASGFLSAYFIVGEGPCGDGELPRVTALDDGAAYAPDSDSWRDLPPPPVTPGQIVASSWSGAELHIWGRQAGVAYEPASNSWRQIAPLPIDAGPRPLVGTAEGGVLVLGGPEADEAIIDRNDLTRTNVSHLRAGWYYDFETEVWTSAQEAPRTTDAADHLIGVGDTFFVVSPDRTLTYQPLLYQGEAVAWEPDASAETQTTEPASTAAEILGRILVPDGSPRPTYAFNDEIPWLEEWAIEILDFAPLEDLGLETGRAGGMEPGHQRFAVAYQVIYRGDDTDAKFIDFPGVVGAVSTRLHSTNDCRPRPQSSQAAGFGSLTTGIEQGVPSKHLLCIEANPDDVADLAVIVATRADMAALERDRTTEKVVLVLTRSGNPPTTRR